MRKMPMAKINLNILCDCVSGAFWAWVHIAWCTFIYCILFAAAQAMPCKLLQNHHRHPCN